MASPEAAARQTIDQLLTAAGRAVQDLKAADIHAALGVAMDVPPGERVGALATTLESRTRSVRGSPREIRALVRTFRDKLLTEIFPGGSTQMSEVPKTLIFAKDYSHAEDIVKIVHEEFGNGNEFAKVAKSFPSARIRKQDLVKITA